jgi:polyhydroxyalkanoate synthase
VSSGVDAWYASAREVTAAWLDVWGLRPKGPPIAQSPRDELPLEGGARLLHFKSRPQAQAPQPQTPQPQAQAEAQAEAQVLPSQPRPEPQVQAPQVQAPQARPAQPPQPSAQARPAQPPQPSAQARPPSILLVPSLINRWYVLDLRPGASLVEALVSAGFDVWVLDWGIPEAEDRYLDWDAVLRRLGRAVRRVQRETGRRELALLGYCMGGTLTAIHAAQHPDDLTALVTLAAPIDFSQGGMLRRMVDPQWFDAGAIADAGNVAPSQMQAGFVALRPTLEAAKLMSMPDLATDAKARDAFLALEAWASDNIPFPGEAYRRYIGELYQRNELVTGTHRANGAPVSLGAIRCPVLAITATRDAICPSPAAAALTRLVGSSDASVLEVPGGHVGAVVGSRAAKEMYPRLIQWLTPRTGLAS